MKYQDAIEYLTGRCNTITQEIIDIANAAAANQAQYVGNDQSILGLYDSIVAKMDIKATLAFAIEELQSAQKETP